MIYFLISWWFLILILTVKEELETLKKQGKVLGYLSGDNDIFLIKNICDINCSDDLDKFLKICKKDVPKKKGYFSFLLSFFSLLLYSILKNTLLLLEITLDEIYNRNRKRRKKPDSHRPRQKAGLRRPLIII